MFIIFMMTAFAWGQQWLLPLPPHGTVAVADEPTAATSGESAATHEARFERGRNPDDEEAATGKDRLNGEHAADAHDESHGDKLDSGELHGGVSSSPGHEDPVAEVLLAILIILLLAKVSGDVFERIGLPAVLGELIVGIVLGNWALFTGSHAMDFFKPHPGDPHHVTGTVLDMLARIGVVLLLFEVGLESRVKEMAAVGMSSLLVAVLGVVAPMLLGFGVGYFMVSESAADWQVPAFLGATLCATSVGITARVLKDLQRNQDRESKIILGAAVIDDVLGLVVLAVVSGVIQDGADFHFLALVKIVGLSIAFLAVSLFLGAVQFPRMLFRAASFLRGHGLLVTTALVICFLFSWGASLVNLAPIIGAFAAGLILEGAHYQDVDDKWKNRRLEDALAPLSALLVPIFFVATGIAVDLSQFSGGSVWMLAIGLTIVAVIGKLVCAWGVREPGLNRLAVGIGMIPRGEVGLIFAQVGQGLMKPNGESVVDAGTYSAIVVMVMVTTMITPPALKWCMSRCGSHGEAEADSVT
ncbi:MAG: cation:proton antiporter [Planctomycetaceae bacterium]|nr:cation:proton antiporter [Planctomycetaceae bacterium]